jgi:Holliday junction resolvase RusA-like endonuclease
MEPPIKPGETWRLTVYGRAVPQGDLTAMPLMKRGTKQPIIGKGGRPIINQVHSNAKALKPWRQEVAMTAIASGWPGAGIAAIDEALIVGITFYFARPDGHYGTGRNAGVLKDSSPLYPEKTGGDLDKLARATLDSLTGIIWHDDKRIVTLPVRRRYGTPERAVISVRRPRARTVGELRELRGVDPVGAEALADELQLDLFAALPTSGVAV